MAEPPHPDVTRFLSQLAATGRPPASTLAPAQTRAAARAGTETMCLPGPRMASVHELVIPLPHGDGKARLYAPFEDTRSLLVFFHGGGFVNCDLDTHDGLCRELAQAGGCKVASVDYRLAPESPFPAAFDDALAATRWLISRASDLATDTHRIIVGGDSAGGNLAAGVAREISGLAGQLLLYPLLDFRYVSPSIAENGEGFMLKIDGLAWFRRHYLPEEAYWRDPRASPGLAAVHSGMAPAYILAAGLDPLRDEALDYADRLRAAGVAVTLRQAPGQIHGFAMMTRIMRDAADAIADAGAWLRAHCGLALSNSSSRHRRLPLLR